MPCLTIEMGGGGPTLAGAPKMVLDRYVPDGGATPSRTTAKVAEVRRRNVLQSALMYSRLFARAFVFLPTFRLTTEVIAQVQVHQTGFPRNYDSY